MRPSLQVLILATTVTTLSCATTPIPIRYLGEPDAITRMAGNWSGTYSVNGSPRSGAISFSLRAGDTVAFGDVLMLPRGYEDHTVWTERERHPDGIASHPSVLTISFVGLWSDGVSGMLDLYTDPEWNCQVLTAFTGRFSSPTTLEGTFVTRIPGTNTTRVGRWSVSRSATPAVRNPQ